MRMNRDEVYAYLKGLKWSEKSINSLFKDLEGGMPTIIVRDTKQYTTFKLVGKVIDVNES